MKGDGKKNTWYQLHPRNKNRLNRVMKELRLNIIIESMIKMEIERIILNHTTTHQTYFSAFKYSLQ